MSFRIYMYCICVIGMTVWIVCVAEESEQMAQVHVQSWFCQAVSVTARSSHHSQSLSQLFFDIHVYTFIHHKGRHVNKEMRNADRQTDRQRYRQTDRQTEIQTDRQTDRDTDRQTETSYAHDSVQWLDLFAWCVRLSLVGFRTHFKSLSFHFIHSFHDKCTNVKISCTLEVTFTNKFSAELSCPYFHTHLANYETAETVKL